MSCEAFVPRVRWQRLSVPRSQLLVESDVKAEMKLTRTEKPGVGGRSRRNFRSSFTAKLGHSVGGVELYSCDQVTANEDKECVW